VLVGWALVALGRDRPEGAARLLAAAEAVNRRIGVTPIGVERHEADLVAEAVRARLADLDGPARDAVEQLAVVPSAVERWLVDAVVPGGLAALAPAERRGVLTVSQARVAFRHELARRTVVDSMPAARRVACNQAVLTALLARPDDVDRSRIMHHAAEAGADDVIVRYGPSAAREAAAAGAVRAVGSPPGR
jgi:hypothetical protein